MKEKVLIQIYKDGEFITTQDVSGFTPEQIAAMILVKEEYGLDCRLKRVFVEEV